MDDAMAISPRYQWDDIQIVNLPVPFASADDKPLVCFPLTVSDLYKQRDPITLYGMNVSASGSYNTVRLAHIGGTFNCPCLLRGSSKKYYTDDELVTVVRLAEHGIHPSIFAVNRQYMVMEKFTMDLRDYLAPSRHLSEDNLDIIATKCQSVIKLLAELDLMCIDVKPQNIVVKELPFHCGDGIEMRVVDVRIIDTDGGFCSKLLEAGATSLSAVQKKAAAFAMSFHVFMHLQEMSAPPQLLRRFKEILSLDLLEAMVIESLYEAMQVALNEHHRMFKWYFPYIEGEISVENAADLVLEIVRETETEGS